MRTWFSRGSAIGPLALGLALFVGCGDSLKLVPAKGRITYKGEPVASAHVNFKGEFGIDAFAVTDEKGEFTLKTRGLDGARPGEFDVWITKYKEGTATGGMGPGTVLDPELIAQARKDQKPPATAIRNLGESEIPVFYANPKTSGLKETVVDDEAANTFEIELTDEAPVIAEKEDVEENEA